MIPKYLKIKGLYSYKTEQEIHFDQLTEAALFGIFGSVGSGKSSILEAITFALYGDTERLNSKGDERSYNMMNLASDEMSLDFECLAGKEGNRYRFSVRGKRNSKNFRDVKAFDRKAYMWMNESWSPIEANDVAQKVIGLSYDNFRRTIIIPQGRFQDFIELGDKDRTNMMKELFNLDKYDLGRKVGSLNNKNKLILSNLEGQLMSLGEATPEMVAQEEHNLSLIRKHIQSLAEQLKEQNEFDKTLTDLKIATDKIQDFTKQIADLEAKKDIFNQREAHLKIYETCSRQFKALLDSKKSTLLSIEKNENISHKNQQRILKIEEESALDKAKIDILRPQYEARESLILEAKELGIVLEILENQIQFDKKSESFSRGVIKQKEKADELIILKNQKQELEVLNETQKSKLPDIQELSSVKSWFLTLDSLQEIKKKTKQEAEALQQEIKEKQGILEVKISEINQVFSLQLLNETTEEILENTFTDLLEKNTKTQQTLTQQLQTLKTQAALQQYATNLNDGDECPLCGAVHHPALSKNGHDFNQEIGIIEAKINDLQGVPTRVRSFQMPVLKVLNEIINLEKSKNIIREKWEENKLNIEAHDKIFIWERFDKNNREGFQNTFDSVADLQKQVSDNENFIKKLTLRFEDESQRKIDLIDLPLQNLQNDLSTLKTTVETLTTQLSKIQISNFENESKESVLSRIDSLKKQYETIKQDFEILQKKVTEIDQEKNTIQGSQQTLLEVIKEGKLSLQDYQQNIDNLLVTNNFESENWVKDVLSKNLAIDSERQAIEDFKRILSEKQEVLSQLKKDFSDTKYDSQIHEQVRLQVRELTTMLNEQRKEEGRIDGLLKKIQADLLKKTELLKQQTQLREREEHLETLGSLFRGNGFVDFVSSIYLQNLFNAANVRFHKMTRQTLHLELGTDNSFWVRDVLNGGQLRLLKTLSGGQKFQAALSLALALADNIHTLTESKHNFFFLDEGFGSLDREALQVVFETLKSLRKENRIVGIISHVEDLQQEIDRYLHVRNDEELGSLIVLN
ncbi:MAG: SMC family ATPase [Arcicella sp.]|nr:SMC family ATPase [Arcicella sp.]